MFGRLLGRCGLGAVLRAETFDNKLMGHAFVFPRRYWSGSNVVASKINFATFCGSFTPTIACVARIWYLFVHNVGAFGWLIVVFLKKLEMRNFVFVWQNEKHEWMGEMCTWKNETAFFIPKIGQKTRWTERKKTQNNSNDSFKKKETKNKIFNENGDQQRLESKRIRSCMKIALRSFFYSAHGNSIEFMRETITTKSILCWLIETHWNGECNGLEGQNTVNVSQMFIWQDKNTSKSRGGQTERERVDRQNRRREKGGRRICCKIV